MKKGCCEFCGVIDEVVGTEFIGEYCVECHEANIEASKDAIKEIKRARLKSRPLASSTSTNK